VAATLTIAQIEALLKLKDELSPALKKAEEAVVSMQSRIEGLEKSNEKASKSFSGFSGASFQFNQITDALGTVVEWGQRAIGVFVELAERGGRVSAVANSFEALSASLGETGDAMLGRLREGTRGLVADFDLMLATNKAVLLGLPVTSKEMGILADTSLRLGQTMGLSTTQALNDLITGLGRGSALILDNLGITVNAAEAYESYAAAIGKTASDLTEGEKKLAVYKAALESASASVGKLGDLQLTFADRMQQTRTAVGNFTDALGMAIARSPVLNELMGTLANTLQEAFGKNQQETIATLIRIINDLAIGTVSLAKVGVQTAAFISNAFNGLKAVFAALLTGMADAVVKVLGLLQSVAEAGGKLPGIVGQGFRAQAADIGSVADHVALVRAQMGEYGAGVVDTIGKTEAAKVASLAWLDALQGRLEAAKSKVIATGNAFSAPAPQGPVAGAKALVAALEAAGPPLDKIKQQVIDLAPNLTTAADAIGNDFLNGVQGAVPPLKEITVSVEETVKKTFDWNKALNDGTAIIDTLAGALDQMGVSADSNLARIVRGFQDLAHAAQDGVKAYAQFASGDIVGGIVSSIKAIGGAVSGIKGLFFSGQEEHKHVNDLRDAYVAAAGGITELDKRAQAAGLTVDRLLDAKKVSEFEAAIAQLNGAFDLQAEAHEKTREAADRYGLTIAELGPKFQQQELDKMVGQLLQDYELLKASGADMNAVIAKMAPNFNEYVQAAVSSGQAIPENMRPIIDQMIEQKLLVDENGEAYGSAEEAGIKYTESLTDGLSRAIDAIERLVNALMGVQNKAGQGIHIPVTYDDDGGPRPHHGVPKQLATGGYATGPTSGYPATLHGNEFVVPESGGYIERLAGMLASHMGSATGARGEALTIDNHLHVASREIAVAQSTSTRRREGRRAR
jgi:hypothetical protein